MLQVHESVDKDLVGKKVSLFQALGSGNFQGTWRQYVYADKNEIMVFPDSVNVDEIACSFVNPVTTCSIVDMTIQGGHKALIHSAACSSLGKMLVKLCKKHDLPLINIVRREEQVKTLKELGAEHIINSSLDSFKDDLKELVEKLEATVFFDAIAGSFTGQVLECMSSGATAYVYGVLSGEAIHYDSVDLLFGCKNVCGYIVKTWLDKLSDEQREKWMKEVTDDLSSGGKIFGSHVAKTMPLTLIKDAIQEYKKVASEGKLLLKPHES